MLQSKWALTIVLISVSVFQFHFQLSIELETTSFKLLKENIKIYFVNMDKSEEMIRKTNILIEKVSYDRAVKDQCEFIYLGAIIARSSP